MSLQMCARSSLSVSRTSAKFLISSIFSKPASAASLLNASPPSALINRSLFHRALSSVATLSPSFPGQASSLRAFSTRPASSSLNDANPNWSNRPPKETILLDGCDFEHWLVVMEKPEGDPTRAEIIDSYIKTLAMVVGSEEEARMKIYSVSTRCYYAFGALVSEELSYKLKELPRVRWVLPDSYLNVKEKDYGGEPFINGEAVPYDPKYHEEWERNNQRAMERNRRNDRPRNTDRSRNFNRNRNMQYQDTQITQPPPPLGANPPPNQTSYQQHNTPPPNTGGFMANQNQGGYPQYNSPPPQQPPHNSPPPHQQMHNSPPPNQPPYQPNQGGYPQSNMMPPNQGRYPPNAVNQGGYPQNNMMPPRQGGFPPNPNGYQQNKAFPPNQGGYQPSYNSSRQNFQNGPPNNPPNPTWNNSSPQNYQDGYSPDRD